MPILVLIMRGYSSGPGFSSWKHSYLKQYLLEKPGQVETVEHTKQYHVKFVEISHYLKRRGRKAFV